MFLHYQYDHYVNKLMNSVNKASGALSVLVLFGRNFPFGLGFLLATFFFVFGTLFGRKKVALLNPFRAAKPTGKLPIKLLQSLGCP